jgi:MFS superfamily sulfate permease-like transporter
MNIPSLARRYFPILNWEAKYTDKTFANDLMVAANVKIMLSPQSPAYAMLAGLPPRGRMFSVLYIG